MDLVFSARSHSESKLKYFEGKFRRAAFLSAPFLRRDSFPVKWGDLLRNPSRKDEVPPEGILQSRQLGDTKRKSVAFDFWELAS